MLHENLIPKKYLQELQECFNNHCEWHFNQNTTYGPSESHLDEGKLGSLGFTMMFFEQERWVPSIPATLVRPLISYIHEKVEEECGEPVSLFRARADMTVYNPENHRHEVHTDFKFPHITAIFYLINSDGNTVLMDKDGNVEEEFEIRMPRVEEVIKNYCNQFVDENNQLIKIIIRIINDFLDFKILI